MVYFFEAVSGDYPVYPHLFTVRISITNRVLQRLGRLEVICGGGTEQLVQRIRRYSKIIQCLKSENEIKLKLRRGSAPRMSMLRTGEMYF